MTFGHPRSGGAFLVVTVVALLAHVPAWAQDGDAWSIVVTPQVWLSHVVKTGFPSAPHSGANLIPIIDPRNLDIVPNPFPAESSAKNDLNPQFGLQLEARRGRLILTGGFQLAEFETVNDIRFAHPLANYGICLGLLPCLVSGQRWAKEIVDTTRLDVDFAASYFIPDVVRHRVDASVGLGFKFVYASADRRHTDLSPPAELWENTPHGPEAPTPGLYTVCADLCGLMTFRRKVTETSFLYGLTLPMTATAHLTRDRAWQLPVSVTPMLGVETRDDHNVVYSVDLPQNFSQLPFVQFRRPIRVNRLDGTTFAAGVTADAAVRWLLTDAWAVQAGMRVQYFEGHDTYLAYGPLLAMSYRFGAK